MFPGQDCFCIAPEPEDFSDDERIFPVVFGFAHGESVQSIRLNGIDDFGGPAVFKKQRKGGQIVTGGFQTGEERIQGLHIREWMEAWRYPDSAHNFIS